MPKIITHWLDFKAILENSNGNVHYEMIDLPGDPHEVQIKMYIDSFIYEDIMPADEPTLGEIFQTIESHQESEKLKDGLVTIGIGVIPSL